MTTNGAIRSLVQAAVSAALAFGPAVAVIEWLGVDVTPAQATMALMPVVMGLYWAAGNAIQNNDRLMDIAPVRVLVGLAMGGSMAPNYGKPFVAPVDEG